MRLSKYEIETIKQTASKTWGSNATIYLFGSRTDDTKKGGDIDLCICLNEEAFSPRDIMLKKAEFQSKLDLALGEQKIDVLIRTNYNKHLPIITDAQKKGIAL